jgi:hypothetical protein
LSSTFHRVAGREKREFALSNFAMALRQIVAKPQ